MDPFEFFPSHIKKLFRTNRMDDAATHLALHMFVEKMAQAQKEKDASSFLTGLACYICLNLNTTIKDKEPQTVDKLKKAKSFREFRKIYHDFFRRLADPNFIHLEMILEILKNVQEDGYPGFQLCLIDVYPNVQEIIDNFKTLNAQMNKMVFVDQPITESVN